MKNEECIEEGSPADILKNLAKQVQITSVPDRSRSFLLTTNIPINEDEAAEIQRNCGYHPWGYGMMAFKCVEISCGVYKSTWSCSHSCD